MLLHGCPPARANRRAREAVRTRGTVKRVLERRRDRTVILGRDEQNPVYGLDLGFQAGRRFLAGFGPDPVEHRQIINAEVVNIVS